MARNHNCAVLVLSQIKRLYKDEKGREVPPCLSDLKECGTIEEESGAVLLLSAEPSTDEIRPVTGVLEKNRYGPKCEMVFQFDTRTTKFSDFREETCNESVPAANAR